jgi:cytochrome oxidase Cu insertion factor (SCO1/SenC/PrrC family)
MPARVLLALGLCMASCDEDPELLELGQIPEFSFTDQDGETFGRSDVEGKVVVATFGDGMNELERAVAALL